MFHYDPFVSLKVTLLSVVCSSETWMVIGSVLRHEMCFFYGAIYFSSAEDPETQNQPIKTALK